MRQKIFKAYQELAGNQKNKIVFFDNKKRIEKSFSDFGQEVDSTINRLNTITDNQKTEKIGILGPSSYMWMVFDHACIKGGYTSVAIPETFSIESVNDINFNLKLDLLLVDYGLKNKFEDLNIKKYYFNCTQPEEQDFQKLEIENYNLNENNIIKEKYSIAFSSGTSEKNKYINLKFYKEKQLFHGSIFNKIKTYLKIKNNIWFILRKKDNRIIIFLPFSHPMQRWFCRVAIIHKVDIVLSDPQNCIKHIILEKPNIMISVPPIYNALAELIKARIKKFSTVKKALFNIFNKLGINGFSDKNLIKIIFASLLFKNVKKLYGERADIFVTGSSPTDAETLKTFYSVGVKVYEAYSLSEWSQIIMNTPKHFKIGSVGKPNMDIKISSESEILLKFEEKYDDVNHSVLDIDKEGYIHTGDLGHIDRKGFLFITGRKDDVIILNTGKKVHPYKIEKVIATKEEIENVIVFSEDAESLNAILFSKSSDLDKIKEHISNKNYELAGYEKIKRFLVVGELPTIENGLLTPTLKLKRKRIINKYKEHSFEILHSYVPD